MELENFESTKYSSLTHPIEISVGLRFNSWEIAEHYLKEYEKQKGFVINWYRVIYDKQLSNSTERNVKKRTFSCEYAGKHKPIKLQPIEQQRNKGSKKLIVNGMLI